MQEVNVDLSRYKKARIWRQENAAALFNTDGSWDWFKRTHRRELIESGALIVRTGRAGDLICVDQIGAVVQKILQVESLKRINPPADL